MDETITIYINDKPVTVRKGSIVSAALAQAGVNRFRQSPSGEHRGPLCGMGVCFECTVTIDGRPHCRSCQTLCENGMRVEVEHG